MVSHCRRMPPIYNQSADCGGTGTSLQGDLKTGQLGTRARTASLPYAFQIIPCAAQLGSTQDYLKAGMKGCSDY